MQAPADFIECYKPENINKRKETWHPEKNPEGRWRRILYEDILARDKTSLDISWIKGKRSDRSGQAAGP